jgi:NADH-quinone oxidoreductase subunit L
MHGNGDETDIKKLGGVRREMKWTWITFLVATLAITGIVPLSGFFSKDAIFHGVHHNELGESLEWVSHLCGLLGYLIAACTAFYMTRLYLLTFEGRRSPEARLAHAHESSWLMTLPLVILGVLSVVASVYAFPLMKRSDGTAQPVFENFLAPVFAAAERISSNGGEVRLDHSAPHLADYLLAWIIVVAAGAVAAFLYMRFFPAQAGKPAPAWARGIRRVAQNKFYVDEAYEFVFIRPLKFLSMILYRVFDALLIDTVMVRGTAWVTTRVGSALRYVQTGDAQSYAAVMALALLGGVAYALIRVLS